jgi:BirA family biotin operon repressor/biotin-[acetyl-CoA-carboxylase] ligase
MELGAEATRVSFLVLGIGVNLNVERDEFPQDFRAFATSLAAHTGRPVDRIAFARRLYGILERTLDDCAEGGFDAIRPRFEARFRMRGRRVRVIEQGGGAAGQRRSHERAGRGDVAGVAAGIDTDGALLVRRDDGETVRVIAGDVTLAKEIA